MDNKRHISQLLSAININNFSNHKSRIQVKQLTYYANPSLSKNRYREFSINKKSGDKRIINAPVKGLKTILSSLNIALQLVHKPNLASTGFEVDKSIVDNARRHAGQNYVLNIDLKDFFHSFDRNRVKLGFMYGPFKLSGNKEPLAFLLACLCTHPIEVDGVVKNVLPQGSPASPTLTNILCQQLDRRLTGLANRFGAKYSRYADDITFSTPHNIYNNKEFIDELHRIIEVDQDLKINEKKTRLQKADHRQMVTGLVVNEKVNVRRKYVKQIRMYLYYWEKYGYETAEYNFRKDYHIDKGHVKKTKPNLSNVLSGKLEFLRMVKGPDDSTYQKLAKRFDSLVLEMDPITKILDEWESKGIASAMSTYYNEKRG